MNYTKLLKIYLRQTITAQRLMHCLALNFPQLSTLFSKVPSGQSLRGSHYRETRSLPHILFLSECPVFAPFCEASDRCVLTVRVIGGQGRCDSSEGHVVPAG